MPFDALTMAAVADEVHSVASGGRIQKILQPSSGSIAVAVYAGGKLHWLAFSADAQHARVYVAGARLAKAFPQPSSFVMLLRKYLEGGRVLGAWSPAGERILTLVCRGADEVRLIAEVMGRHSNVILVDADDTVLGAVKMVSMRQSRVRPIAPGVPYRPPPKQHRDPVIYSDGDRVDPYRSPDIFEDLIGRVQAHIPLHTALMGLLAGANPFLVQQISRRAGYAPTQNVGTLDLARVCAAAQQLFSLYASHTWEPCTFEDERGSTDSAPYVPVGVQNVRPAPSVSAALEASIGEREHHDVHSTSRQLLLNDIERRQRLIQRRILSLEDGLVAAANAESVMEQGQLILSYGYNAHPGENQLIIPDFDLTIPLNPRLSITENAEKLFKRYRKLRDARARIPSLRRGAELEAERLTEIATFTRLADSEAALVEIRRELEGETVAQTDKKAQSQKRRGPARFRLDAATAIVGRNARENEEVTFKIGRRDDTWLHARERTGAHVILQGTGDWDEEILLAAAQLAAYFSEGRDDSAVDVDVTKVRNVRKIPAGSPGRVTYTHARTLRVKPTREKWHPLRT